MSDQFKSESDRLYEFIACHRHGVNKAEVSDWIDWPDGIESDSHEIARFERALRDLRDSGRIAIANGIWYARGSNATKEK